jgi:predicted double-glycine peptidase
MRFVALLLLAACGGVAPGSFEDDAADVRSVALPSNAVAVPLVRQQTSYSCGPASALALLRYWRHEQYKQVPEKALYGPMGTTEKDGTDPRPIAAYLTAEQGLSAEFVTGAREEDLLRAIDRGEPPIVDLQAWQDKPHDWASDWIDGHYAVLTGYDADNFYFMDPSTGRHDAYVPRAQFRDRWHDVLGARQKVQHMAIFVRSRNAPWTGAAVPPRATLMN